MIKKIFNHFSWLLVLLNVFGSKVNGQCYQSTYGRGVGKVLSTCNSDEEKNGLLCYPKCRKDYFGNGPICYEQCRNGYSNTGKTCFRGIDTYTKRNMFSDCNSGYTDLGFTCWRAPDSYWSDSYGRGVGSPLRCESGLEQSGALCYVRCKDGYDPFGPLCWLGKCQGAFNYSCKLHTICANILLLGPIVGVPLAALCESKGLMCTRDFDQCKDINIDILVASASTVIGIATVVATAGFKTFYLKKKANKNIKIKFMFFFNFINLGADPGAWLATLSGMTDLTSNLLNDGKKIIFLIFKRFLAAHFGLKKY